ncbi:primase/helicase [Synechococcus phage Syn5]|uniref:DNA helicase/primase n=1 Tax=Synechococcus phage Syn5 TaxID=2914003 RepID=A4ZRA5_9CAUD|nr:primase/helicase [Synechococcus phage Syn5]ABP87931.1 primase/helicase [Synechococcus phage Syn5]
MSDENEFIRHEHCPECPSSDAFAIYSDGSGYCFSCGHSTRGTGETLTPPSSSPRVSITYSGDFSGIRSRKITEDTCKKFNVRVDAGPVIRFPYYSSAGRVCSYKERPQAKEFHWVGKNEDKQLFGQQLFGKGKSIVITEGEFDALAVWQARPNWPVCSVPNGAQGAKKSLSLQLDYLLKFDEIILMFDNDEAGIAAAEECVQLFPADKVFLAPLSQYKDACEALQAGDTDAIRQAVWNKRTYSPKSIIDGRELFDLVSTPLHGRDADYPYSDLNKVTGGLRLGELVTITAGSGTGKSTLCGEIAVSLISQGESVGYIALEESVKRTGLRLMTVEANKPLHLDNKINETDFKRAFDQTLGSGRVYLRDGFGSVDPDQLLNDVRYLVKTNEVKWIVLDHLSILLSGNESNDERKMIDITMTKLRSFVEETGIGMILISHLRRVQGDKGHEDGASVSLGQLRGSHAIAQLSDLVVALQRDISAGDNRSELVVLKNRFNGQTGPAGKLSYGLETGRLTQALFDATDSPSPAPTSYDDF